MARWRAGLAAAGSSKAVQLSDLAASVRVCTRHAGPARTTAHRRAGRGGSTFCATLVAVEKIGIRELRQHASRWVAKAKAGATIQITDRGRPVARLIPADPVETGRDALIAEGLLIPAANPRTPLRADNLIEGPPLSPILDELRADR